MTGRVLAGAILISTTTASHLPAPVPSPFELSADLQPPDANLRHQVRLLTRELEEPSCASLGVPRGFDRAKALQPERAAVDDFKDRIKGSPAYFHFVVGVVDARNEMAGGGCWNDSESWIAELHVKDAKADTKRRLSAAEKLGSEIGEPANVGGTASPQKAAPFRRQVRDLMQMLHPRCYLTTEAANSELVQPALLALSRFRKELEGGPYSIHFDIAKGDVAFEQSISVVECDDPGSASVKHWQDLFLRATKKGIARLRVAVRTG